MSRFTCALLLTSLVASPVVAQQDTQLKGLYKKRRAVYFKLSRLRSKLNKNPEIIKLRKAWDTARQDLDKKVNSKIGDLRKAERKARGDLYKAVKAVAEASEDMKKVREAQQTAENLRRQLSFKIAMVELQLNHRDSPLQQKLDLDPEVKKLKEARTSGTSKERNAAWRKYRKVRNEKLSQMPAAKPLFATVKQLKQQMKEASKQYSKQWSATYKVLRSYQSGKKDNDQIKALRKEHRAASSAANKAYYEESKKLKKERDAARAASRAYFKRLGELSKQDKAIQEVQSQLNELSKEIQKIAQKKRRKKKA